jgi:hypothetical protein
MGGTETGGTGGMGTGGTGATTGGPLDCLGCIGQECPFIAECVQDMLCYERLACTVEVCLQGNDISIECVIRCHDGDLVAAGELAVALNCAAESCGDRCEFE